MKKHYLVSPIPEDIVANMRDAVKLLREDPTNRKTSTTALNAVRDITSVSLNYYFLRPIALLKLGMIPSGILKMGVQAGIGVLNTFGGRLISSLSKEQMITLADVIESSVIELEELDLL